MKYVRKWTPVSSYDIQGLESWLQDLALQGLYLEQFRPLFCTFYSDAAKRTRYRIEPTTGGWTMTCPGPCWSYTNPTAGRAWERSVGSC